MNDDAREPSPEFPGIPLKKRDPDEYGVESMQAEATRLMQRAKDGDRDAFDRLVEGLRGRAFAVAKSLVGSHEEALDLSQEAFLKTYRARATFKDGEPFLPWFHRILRNTCFSHLRKSKRRNSRSLSQKGADDEEVAIDLVDERTPLPSESAERTERARLFWDSFQELSDRDREILGLRHFKDLPYQEIADALEIPVGTVMSRLFHARRRLRERLEPVLDAVPRGDDADDADEARGAGARKGGRR